MYLLPLSLFLFCACIQSSIAIPFHSATYFLCCNNLDSLPQQRIYVMTERKVTRITEVETFAKLIGNIVVTNYIAQQKGTDRREEKNQPSQVDEGLQ